MMGYKFTTCNEICIYGCVRSSDKSYYWFCWDGHIYICIYIYVYIYICGCRGFFLCEDIYILLYIYIGLIKYIMLTVDSGILHSLLIFVFTFRIIYAQWCHSQTLDILQTIFSNAFSWLKLKFVPKVWIIDSPALVQIMVWCLTGEKPMGQFDWANHGE